LGSVGGKTEVVLDGIESHYQYSRLDMDYLCELSAFYSNQPEYLTRLCYHKNNSLYKVHDRYRYVEYKIQDKYRSYRISEVDWSIQLEKILEIAEEDVPFDQLVSIISDDEITKEEANDFIIELIQNQLLICQLEPSVTGDDYLNKLISCLVEIPGGFGDLQRLKQIQEILSSKHRGIREYRYIQESLHGVLGDKTSKDLVHTDLYLASHQCKINVKSIDHIVNDIHVLLSISRPAPQDSLRRFKEKFVARFEMQEVSLLYALDPEIGIGYDGIITDRPLLLEQINIGDNAQNAIRSDKLTDRSDKLTEFRNRKLIRSIKDGHKEIVITKEDVEELRSTSPISLPYSMFIMGNLIGSSSAIDEHDFQFVIQNVSGPSAANPLGRFCNGDKELTQRVREYLLDEEKDMEECIFAEVAHLPQTRIGNIVSRPVLRTYEIPYLAASGVTKENQIPAADLYISVNHAEIVLKSKTLNRRIIPRLSTGHNYSSGSLALYRFLGDLQRQHTEFSSLWDWGLNSNVSFLPRVSYGRIVLSQAQWLINLKDHTELRSKSFSNLLPYFKSLTDRYELPRFVLLSEGDNELFIDMENETCLQLLKDRLTKRKLVKLVEFLSTTDRCFVQNSRGEKFASEIVIPIRKSGSSPKQPIQHEVKSPAGGRSFAFGSEWLYVKIYCGPKTAERIMIEAISPLVKTLLSERIIQRWFFIRYADPDAHIRIRFHGANKFWIEVMDRMNHCLEHYLGEKLITKLQIDTYDRELERYGHQTIEKCENLFWHDSEAVLGFIQHLVSDEDETYRWLFALRSIDALLEDFKMSLKEKAKFIETVQGDFFKEFSVDSRKKYSLDVKYRQETNLIKSHMNPLNDERNEFIEANDLLRRRSKMVAENIVDIKGSIATGLNQIIASIVHMNLNRLLVTDHRKQELVIYHFLYNHYQSKLAMEEKT
jgi:thiopeptide-type bacteriocin biosynthesis protein